MGRFFYTPGNSSVASGDTTDFWEWIAPSTGIWVLHRIELGQGDINPLDNEDVMTNVKLRRATIAGSGGASGTKVLLDEADSAIGGSVDIDNTTIATGTVTTVFETVFNILAGWFYTPILDRERIIIPPSGILVARIINPASTAVNFQGTALLEEIAG